MTSFELLADPARLAVARSLAEARDPSAPEIAEATGLHLNTVRAHLQALESAGAVERSSASGGAPGRPVVRYRLRREFVPSGEELLPLSGLLADALLASDPDPAALREAAVEWGRRWSSEGEGPVEERLVEALERLGFNVELEGRRVTLRDCPCPLVAPKRPGLVCGLADAVADGVLEGSARRARHHAHHPKARRCTATLARA